MRCWRITHAWSIMVTYHQFKRDLAWSLRYWKWNNKKFNNFNLVDEAHEARDFLLVDLRGLYEGHQEWTKESYKHFAQAWLLIRAAIQENNHYHKYTDPLADTPKAVSYSPSNVHKIVDEVFKKQPINPNVDLEEKRRAQEALEEQHQYNKNRQIELQERALHYFEEQHETDERNRRRKLGLEVDAPRQQDEHVIEATQGAPIFPSFDRTSVTIFSGAIHRAKHGLGIRQAYGFTLEKATNAVRYKTKEGFPSSYRPKKRLRRYTRKSPYKPYARY